MSDAFLAAGTLLASSDGNTSFRPAPMAASAAGLPRQLGDLELLGRFLGLALIQQVTVGVRLHPLVCKLLLRNGEAWEWTHDDVQSLDPLLYKHKVQYVLENPVDALCLNFTDVLHDTAADAAGDDAAAPSGASSTLTLFFCIVCRSSTSGHILRTELPVEWPMHDSAAVLKMECGG